MVCVVKRQVCLSCLNLSLKDKRSVHAYYILLLSQHKMGLYILVHYVNGKQTRQMRQGSLVVGFVEMGSKSNPPPVVGPVSPSRSPHIQNTTNTHMCMKAGLGMCRH